MPIFTYQQQKVDYNSRIPNTLRSVTATWQDSSAFIQPGHGSNIGRRKLVKFLVPILFPQGPPTFLFPFFSFNIFIEV